MEELKGSDKDVDSCLSEYKYRLTPIGIGFICFIFDIY